MDNSLDIRNKQINSRPQPTNISANYNTNIRDRKIKSGIANKAVHKKTDNLFDKESIQENKRETFRSIDDVPSGCYSVLKENDIGQLFFLASKAIEILEQNLTQENVKDMQKGIEIIQQDIYLRLKLLWNTGLQNQISGNIPKADYNETINDNAKQVFELTKTQQKNPMNMHEAYEYVLALSALHLQYGNSHQTLEICKATLRIWQNDPKLMDFYNKAIIRTRLKSS